MKAVISVPLKLEIHSKKSKYFYLNLNIYRNAHFFLLDKAKKVFGDTIWNDIVKLPKFKQCTLEYIVYPQQNKKKFDISNTCCIVDKFFSDTFVEAGKIEDDSFQYITGVKYSYGAVNKENPHVDVIIEGIPDESVSCSE